MKNLKLFLVVLLVFSYSGFTFCQTGMERKEKIEAQKITYLTNQMNLTPEEAQIFWPLYNEYQQKKEELKNSKKSSMQDYRFNPGDLNENEIEKIVDDYIDIQVKEAELMKEYHEKYKTVLPIEKVIKLYQAENQFKQFLLKQIKEQGGGNSPKRNN